MRLSAAHGCRWHGVHTRRIAFDAAQSACAALSSVHALGKLFPVVSSDSRSGSSSYPTRPAKTGRTQNVVFFCFIHVPCDCLQLN